MHRSIPVAVLALAGCGGETVNPADAGPPDAPLPALHESPEGDLGHPACEVTVSLNGTVLGTVYVGGVFPEWVPVEPTYPVQVLEGEVIESHVSWTDFPTTHYTHDFDFAVRPDAPFANLRGVQVQGDGTKSQQEEVEVEWEMGLASAPSPDLASPCAAPNDEGASCGAFSGGHARGEPLWAWPAPGDRVHVVGRWIWDRGHPPDLTEVHPPRLVAVQRKLPALAAPGVYGTRIDVYASGDGGALRNNRPDAPAFVEKVPMSDRDYSFRASDPIAPAGSPLTWRVDKRPGDSFPVDPVIVADGDGVRVTLPWRSGAVPDDAVFARTIYLYSEAPPLVAMRKLRVHLDDVTVNAALDGSSGDYRLFVEAGGEWYFANELATDTGAILSDGLGRTPSGMTWPLGKTVDLVVPDGYPLRIHADGLEADGISLITGDLIDNSSSCETLQTWLPEHLFTPAILAAGCNDDPIGEVNEDWTGEEAAAAAPVDKRVDSAGDPIEDTGCGVTVMVARAFTLHYRIEALP